MKLTTPFTCSQDADWWLGCLNQFPDHWTQGRSFAELKGMLASLHKDLTGGDIPGV